MITEIATAQDFRFSNATSQLATESGNEDYIEILKKHSELGDMGIISSEELEFKKKQLLGL